MSYRAIVTLDVGVVLRLSRLDVFDVNAPCLSPCLEQTTDVFWAVIDTNDLRRAAPLDDLVQAAYDTHSWQREVHFDTQPLTVVIVQHIEGSELATICKLILHEVHRPSMVGDLWHRQRVWLMPLQPLSWPDTQVQLQLTVDPVHAFVVPLKALHVAQI